MRFAVLVQPTAEEEIDAAFVYLASEASLEVAARWYNRLEESIATLANLPRRCPVAPEDALFEEEIRHLLVDPYRVIFTIRGKQVHILHVRHMARRSLGVRDE